MQTPFLTASAPLPRGAIARIAAWAASLAVAALIAGCGASSGDPTPPPTPPADPTFVIKKSAIQGGIVYSPDQKMYLVNKEDANGTAQIYVGQAGSSAMVCITDVQRTGGPAPTRFKMQPHWHPSGKWIFIAVERDDYTPPWYYTRDVIEGILQCGIWTNMYAVSPDGLEWHRLTDFKSNIAGVPDGYTGPAITPDGKHAVWSQIVDGNIFSYWPFGKWQLIRADYAEVNGIPSFINQTDITPSGMNWNEPGNFHPDNVSVLLSGSVEADAQGMDQYILDINTGALKNLTNSKTVWDEHGVFSPDGKKIIFMSAYPYRADPNSSKIATIKTEFMLMNSDGSGLTQLTHFYQPGYVEYSAQGGTAAAAEWSHDGKSANLSQLFFPNYAFWDVIFTTPAASSAIAPSGNG